MRRSRSTLRTVTAVIAASFLHACATAPPLARSEGIVELAGGRALDRGQLLDRLRAVDIVLLGELHDNPAHHARRGELIAALRPPLVVAEQLTAGAQLKAGGDLLAGLTEAGFEAKPWGWPMHQPVFAAAVEAGSTVRGGNLRREEARRIATQGESAWPDELRPTLAAAPLDEAGRAALDDDLIRGHCGRLSAARLPAMRAAQRARDASMAEALLAGSARPVVLVAGNGHVRTDYGVGQMLARLRPAERVASVGFVEVGQAMPSAAQYTFAWVTEPAARDDPCARMSALPAG